MVATVTLNPAIDKTYTASTLHPGEVNRMNTVKNIAGGKGINVTKVLRQYGYQVRVLGFLGGYTGSMIEDYIKEIGAECCFTHIKGSTRVNINILEEDGYVTELLEPGPFVDSEEFKRFFEDFSRAIEDCDTVVLSGSAPENIPVFIYRDLILRAKNQKKKVILDSSGKFLIESINTCPFMVKPNILELEALSGRKIRGLDDAIGAALQIGGRGIPHVVVSMGASGILYVNDRKIYFAKVPPVKAVNTIGCGDSVVAAFIMAYDQGMDVRDILKHCVGISAANVTTFDSAVIPMKTAKELINKVEIIKY